MPGDAGTIRPATVGNFQVDLRGIVDRGSHHLCSSPRVYVRDLLRDAVDAVDAVDAASARRLTEPAAPPRSARPPTAPLS
jgi:molecular chaperone HtpG